MKPVGRADGFLIAVLVALAFVGCGQPDDASLATGVTATTIESPVVSCASGAEQFSVTQVPPDAPVAVPREEVEQILRSQLTLELADQPRTISLVRVSVPGTFSNGEPSFQRYEPGIPGDPGRIEDRLAWRVSIEERPGTMKRILGPEARLVPDPQTCTIKQVVTFIDATSAWPLASFSLT